jgi:hypothetical protein
MDINKTGVFAYLSPPPYPGCSVEGCAREGEYVIGSRPLCDKHFVAELAVDPELLAWAVVFILDQLEQHRLLS